VWATDTNNREEVNGSYGFSWPDAAGNPVITGNPRQLEKIIERHLGTTNVLYCDGHVKAMKLDALSATRVLTDPVDGQTKSVMTAFTIEND
jgi:prepilin-type processing-associated H-X9-DG protein